MTNEELEQAGTAAANALISATRGEPGQRLALAALVNRGNEGLMAIDLGDVDAKHVFAESKPTEFEAVRAAEVARRLDEVLNPTPKSEAADSIDAAVAAEVAKR